MNYKLFAYPISGGLVTNEYPKPVNVTKDTVEEARDAYRHVITCAENYFASGEFHKVRVMDDDLVLIRFGTNPADTMEEIQEDEDISERFFQNITLSSNQIRGTHYLKQEISTEPVKVVTHVFDDFVVHPLMLVVRLLDVLTVLDAMYYMKPDDHRYVERFSFKDGVMEIFLGS